MEPSIDQTSLAASKKASGRKEAAVSQNLAFLSYRWQNQTAMSPCKHRKFSSNTVSAGRSFYQKRVTKSLNSGHRKAESSPSIENNTSVNIGVSRH